MRAAPLAFASIVTTLTLSSGAFPHGAAKHPMTAARASTFGPAALRFGRSIGSPTEGRLMGGMHLEEAPYLRVVPAYAAGDARWGLEPLVAMIDRAARAVRRKFPEAVVSVGQLSQAGGGDIDRHRSHESGRDADVSFFVHSASGKQLQAPHFVAFRSDGTAPSWPGAVFDDAKNWTLVAAMVSDPEARVTHIFVAAPLRARLLAYAERTGAPTTTRVRAAEAMQQPHGALPHDDHFHVRIGCPAHMSGCVENPAVPQSRLSPNLAGRRHARGEAAWSTTPDEGRGLPLGRAMSMPKRPPLPGLPGGVPPTRHSDFPPEGDDAPRDLDVPPASMTAPIDDVDG